MYQTYHDSFDKIDEIKQKLRVSEIVPPDLLTERKSQRPYSYQSYTSNIPYNNYNNYNNSSIINNTRIADINRKIEVESQNSAKLENRRN
jgi:hypothetical protein